MILATDQKRILESTKKHWVVHVNDPAFRAIFSGKEIGHRIADHVDEQTTEVISGILPTAKQVLSTGELMSRSMGDIWVRSKGMFNPLNVKCGIWGKNAKPNMVALQKLLDSLLTDEIDSYYLLIIKIETLLNATGHKELVPRVFLVDLLEIIDFLAFDSGPGQLMLKEKKFYDHMESGAPTVSRTIEEKVRLLIALREDGDRRLTENRSAALVQTLEAAKRYEDREDHKIIQRELNFDQS